MKQLANPLHYPLAVLAGGAILVLSARVLDLPAAIGLPVSGVVAIAGAAARKATQPPELDSPELTRRLQAARQQAVSLAASADSLRQEAANLLTDADQLDLLSTVQYACDRACELPNRIDTFAQRLQGGDSLLSERDLQAQLDAVRAQRAASTGIAREQVERLAASLERNLALARQGQDAREAQVLALSTGIADTAGILQQLQNRLRTADLGDRAQLQALQTLGNDLQSLEANLDLIVAR